MPRPHVTVIVAVVLCLLGLGAYGRVQDRRADRAEAALADAQQTLAARDVELDGCQSDNAELRDVVARQNAAVDDLAAEGTRQAARVATGDAEARVLREIARTRVERILTQPAPTSCADAIALLRSAAPQLAQEWAQP